MLGLGQALSPSPSICFLAHNEMRTLFTAKRLKHSPESKDEILPGYKHPLGVRMKWAVVRSRFAYVVRRNIEGGKCRSINQFVKIWIETRMLANRGDVLHQVSSSHIARSRTDRPFWLLPQYLAW